MLEEQEFKQQMQRIEALVNRIKAITDPEAAGAAIELLQSLMALHGAGIERMLDITWEAGEQGRAIIDDFARDDLVASLLLLYGLHPLDLETRVAEALEKMRPHLRSQGCNAELLAVADSVVRLRFESSPNGCASSAQALRSAVEDAIYDAAPDVNAIEIEAAEQPASIFVPIEKLRGIEKAAQHGGQSGTTLQASIKEDRYETERVGGSTLASTGQEGGKGDYQA